MPDHGLEEALDKLLADLRAEALELHRKGVPLDRLMELALAVCNAKALGTMRSRAALAMLPGRMRPPS